MKIAIDLTSLADNFSGFERFALNTAKELLEQEKDNFYTLIFKDNIHPEFQRYCGNEKVNMILLPRKSKLWFYQVTLYRALKRIDSDVYVFPAFPSPVLFKRKGIVNTIHDLGCWDCPETMTKKMVFYFRIMYRNAARVSEKIITVSQFSRRRIQKILNIEENKICVVYNGVSPNLYKSDERRWEFVKKKYNIPDEYFMCLSTLEPRKNLGLLLQAYFYLVKENVCPYKLVLAGRKGWKTSQFLADISETDMDRLCFTGYVEDEDLPLLYSHAQLFVFPTLYEGFGIPPLEAMASGCAVVSSDAEVMREILGDYAIYFENNNAESLERVLENWMAGKVESKSSEDLIEYSKKFSYKKSISELIKALKKE